MKTNTHTITRYCPTCNDDRAFLLASRRETHAVRGIDVTADIPFFVCESCSCELLDPEQDPMVAVYAAYRDQEGLLYPEQIKQIRERYGFSREALAELLGMSAASFYRYEAGGLQDRLHDELLRACEESHFVIHLVGRHRARLGENRYRKFVRAIENNPQAIRAPLWSEMTLLRPEFNGFRLFDYERFAFLVRTLCDVVGSSFSVKLNKLCFYADFLACKERGQSISGSPYTALQMGPVPKEYGALLDCLVQDEFLQAEVVDFTDKSGQQQSGTRFTPGPNVPKILDGLDEDELTILQFVGKHFHHTSRQEIEDQSHKEKAWQETPPKKLISYKFASRLSISRISDDT